jgi:hypothetical protein
MQTAIDLIRLYYLIEKLWIKTMTNNKTIRVLSGSIVALLIFSSSIISCEGAETTHPIAQTTALPNILGINISAPLDYDEDRLFADVIRVSRVFKSGPNEKSETLAPVDKDGWPMSDFSFYVWAGIDHMDGTYVLSFKGQANVLRNGGRMSISYDPDSNTSTGTIHIIDSSSSRLALSFTNTKRNNSSISGSGVTSIKLMRPLSPGSSKSYATSALFTKPIKALIAKFSVVRFMDFLSTNGNVQKHWADRPLPSWASFNRNPGKAYGWQGIGGPWEYVILLSNQTGKDAWINIPVMADDDYVLNVARMFAYGSDGVNPYTSFKKNPVYPPLNPKLKLYVEYSNELWNSAGPFPQFHDNCKEASDELVSTSGKSPLNWDGIWNGVAYNSETPDNWNWKMCGRHTTKRSVEISNIFRSVFGDAAMVARVRPVLMSQLGYAGGTLFNEMKMMLEYYDNMAGDYVANPHSPKYYFYGAGGSAYYDPSPKVSTLDAFFEDAGMKPAGIEHKLQDDAHYVAAMGLKRVAYEGGPSLDSDSGARDAISPHAVNDKRMTNAMVEMHNAWSNNGGDLLVYYVSTGGYQWGFTSDVYNLSTPKLRAIDALNAAQRAPLTLGTFVPGSIVGSAADTCSRGWKCSPIPDYDYFTADGSRVMWASYTFSSKDAAAWTVNLSVSNVKNAIVGVYVDGTLVGTQSTRGGKLTFKSGTINAGLHGLIVRAVSGRFSLDTVAVTQN